jgi:hypothetical protein
MIALADPIKVRATGVAVLLSYIQEAQVNPWSAITIIIAGNGDVHI